MTTATKDGFLSASIPAQADAPWIDRLAGRNLVAALALVILALIAFAPGFVTMPPMDRDEPRFAQASKQMLETGDFVNIRFQNETRLKKPVGIYWLQVAAVSVGSALGVEDARTRIALYRIPSLVGAIGAVLLTWWTGLALVGRRAAFLAGAMMAASILLGVEARLAKTDAALLLTVLGMMGALAHLLQRSKDEPQGHAPLWLPALFWTSAAGSILVKGPIGPLVVSLTLAGFIALTRQWRWLKALRWPLGLAFDAAARLALVHRHHGRDRRRVFEEIRWRRHAQQGRGRPGIAWRAARRLSRGLLGDVLALRPARRAQRALRLAQSRAPADRLPPRVAGALLAALRDRCRPSCRTMCCRSIPRSLSLSPPRSPRAAWRGDAGPAG